MSRQAEATSELDLLARARARVGMVLRGKYRLDAVLGLGGMSVVYAATHRNKKRFAVKVLHPELSLHAEVRRRFLGEGYAANSVEHPGAVAVLDDDVSDDGAAFLVMELLDGETAEDMLERTQRVPVQVALAIAVQALDVLAAAHAHGVVHRDVKPANLFLTRRGDVKLLDFGVARVRDAASSRNTQAGAIMGTAGFMAPEQALGKMEDIDALTDVWAVGATIFNLVTGRCVHEGDNPQETVVYAATRPAPSLETVMPEAPRPVVEAVDRALAFERAGRWPSAAAMRDGLQEAAVAAFGGLEPLPSFPESATVRVSESPRSSRTSATTPEMPRPRRRGALVLGGLAGGALVAVLVFARSSPPRPPPASAAVDTSPPPAPRPPEATADPPPPAVPTPVAAVSHPAPSTKKPPAPVRTAAAPSAARCNPPFYFDAQGNRVFKKECL